MATATMPTTQHPVTISATKLLINNRWIPSVSGKEFSTVNPSTGEEICRIAEADAADVNKAVAAARAAFERGPWKKINASEGGPSPHGLSALLDEDTDELRALEGLGNGKP